MLDYVVCGQRRKFGQQKASHCQKRNSGQQFKGPSGQTLPMPSWKEKPWGVMKREDFASFINNWKTHWCIAETNTIL